MYFKTYLLIGLEIFETYKVLEQYMVVSSLCHKTTGGERQDGNNYVTIESAHENNLTLHAVQAHLNKTSPTYSWFYYIKYLIAISMEFDLTSLLTNTAVGFHYVSHQTKKYTKTPLMGTIGTEDTQFLSQPLGVILHTSDGGSHNGKFIITVSSIFSIKLTFQEFIMKYPNNDCSTEYLALEFGSSFLRFCGHRPPWEELIDAWYLEIHLNLPSKVFSKILMSYSVIDQVHVLPKLLSTEDDHGLMSVYLDEHIPVWRHHFSTSLTIMWRIQTRMIEAVIVDIRNKTLISDFAVFDGPVSADEFKLGPFNETAYKSSGFVVLLTCVACNIMIKTKIYLAFACFSNIDHVPACSATIEDQFINFSRSSTDYTSNNSICFLILNQSPFVNVTIVELETSGPNAEMCIHVGFFIYIFPHLEYEDDGIIGPYCDSDTLHRITRSPFNSIISYGSRLLLGLYMYGVWDFTLRAFISQTNCQGIFQPCGPYISLQKFPIVFHNQYTVERKLGYYNEKLVTITNIETCVVIQQFPLMKEFGIYWCEISTDMNIENTNQVNTEYKNC